MGIEAIYQALTLKDWVLLDGSSCNTCCVWPMRTIDNIGIPLPVIICNMLLLPQSLPAKEVGTQGSLHPLEVRRDQRFTIPHVSTSRRFVEKSVSHTINSKRVARQHTTLRQKCMMACTDFPNQKTVCRDVTLLKPTNCVKITRVPYLFCQTNNKTSRTFSVAMEWFEDRDGIRKHDTKQSLTCISRQWLAGKLVLYGKALCGGNANHFVCHSRLTEKYSVGLLLPMHKRSQSSLDVVTSRMDKATRDRCMHGCRRWHLRRTQRTLIFSESLVDVPRRSTIKMQHPHVDHPS